MRYGFVYETTNLINGTKYIGKHKRSQNPIDPDDSDYLGSGKFLDLAVIKYGKENFSRRIICECDSEEELQEREKYYINYYKAVDSPDYYNICLDANPPKNNYTFGDAIRGRKQIHLGEETKFIKLEELDKYLDTGWELGPSSRQKKNQSKRAKDRLVDPKNHPMYGRHHTEETRKKLKENHPDFSGKNHPMYGRHFNHSDEAKAKIAEASRVRRYANRVYHLKCRYCGKEFLGNASNIKLCDTCKSKGVVL